MSALAIDETPPEPPWGWDDDVPLGAAREWLREEARADGAHCPCCTQFAKVYRRTINAAMAVGLVRIWRTVGRDDFHMPTVLDHIAGDHAKLRYWGLLDELDTVRDDGGRAGWYRITALGRDFVLAGARVPKYALVYDGRLLDLDGESVGIVEALGKRFNLLDLLGDQAGDLEVPF